MARCSTRGTETSWRGENHGATSSSVRRLLVVGRQRQARRRRHAIAHVKNSMQRLASRSMAQAQAQQAAAAGSGRTWDQQQQPRHEPRRSRQPYMVSQQAECVTCSRGGHTRYHVRKPVLVAMSHPKVKWAQRKDKLFITIDVQDIQDEVMTLTADKLLMTGKVRSPPPRNSLCNR
eukprot:COSAG01_NODE_257_length_20101_cov_142.726427_28_plen_176_part_00